MPAQLGLTSYRWNNNFKSILLLAAFPLLLLGLLGGVFFAFGLFGGGNGQETLAVMEGLNIPPVLGTGSPADFALSAMAAFWPIIFGIAAIWLVIGYFFNGAIIHMATGARPVTREEAPQLYNLLENLCISRGLAMPKLFVIDSDEMNAYASGIDQKSYAITVTRGLLDTLNAQEIEAVLAHELTHIIDRDCRLLIVTIVFTGMISFLAQMLWRSLQLAAFTRGRSRGNSAVIVLVVIAAIAAAVGYVLALVLRFALSRRRELLADAGSVELTKNPDALISALLKISKNPMTRHVPSEVRQMFIENPPSGFDLGGLFATHPPIATRIHILEELGGRPPAEETAAAPRASTPAAPATANPGDGPWGPHTEGPWGPHGGGSGG
ncbi:MAG TPA: M48 family metallopeptidase [Rhizomicrobium sp.]|nr:M48 family metallopeptidase [Rhizomicrobium sp.]